MKTAGLIGGMSWESTLPYYEILNRGINARLGKNHSARCIVYSLDFQEIEELQYAGEWDALGEIVRDAGRRLKAAGADFALLCTNTMHKVADGFEEAAGLPLLHIADAAGRAAAASGLRRVGLLGTKFTMEEDFYKDKLARDYGLEVVIPGVPGRKAVNDIIYGELVKGIVRAESRDTYLAVMDALKAEGAEGIILGCTEIGLLVKEYSLPLFDTARIHAENALEEMLSGGH